MSFWSEPIVATKEELEPIKGGANFTIVSYTFFLPIEFVEVVVVVVNF